MVALCGVCLGVATTAGGAPVSAVHADHFVEHLGVNTHFSYTDTPYGTHYLDVKARLKELGIRYVRDGMVKRDLFQDIGVRFLLVSGSWGSTLTEAELDAFLTSVRSGGADAVLGLEGANEFNNSQAPDWIARLRAHTELLHTKVKADPSLNGLSLVGPSLAAGNYADVGDLSPWVDYGCVHWYAGDRQESYPPPEFNYFTWHRDQAQAYMYPGKKLWLTETGFVHGPSASGTNPGITLAAGAKYIPRAFLWQLYVANVERVFLYELSNEPPLATTWNSREAAFGLLDDQAKPKPAFESLRNLIALLADPGPIFAPSPLELTIAGGTADITSQLFQRRDGTYLLAMWREVQSFDVGSRLDIDVPRVTVSLSLGAPMDVQVFEPAPPPIGNGATPRQSMAQTQTLQVSVPDHVVVLQLTAPTARDAGRSGRDGGDAGPSGRDGGDAGPATPGRPDAGTGDASGQPRVDPVGLAGGCGCGAPAAAPRGWSGVPLAVLLLAARRKWGDLRRRRVTRWSGPRSG